MWLPLTTPPSCQILIHFNEHVETIIGSSFPYSRLLKFWISVAATVGWKLG